MRGTAEDATATTQYCAGLPLESMKGPGIDPSKLEIHWKQVLGTGGAGQVVRGTLTVQQDGADVRKPVAVKILDDDALKARGEQSLDNELELLTSALSQCDAVCKLYGSCVKEKRRCLVLELYEKSLSDFQAEHVGASIPSPCTLRQGCHSICTAPAGMPDSMGVVPLPAIAAHVALSLC